VLQHEDRWVYLTAREPRPLLRTFIQRGPDFGKGPISLPEQFFLDFFEKNDAFSSSQMVGLIGERLEEDPGTFKSDYVYKDLHKKGYCRLFLVNTSEGNRRLKSVDAQINALKETLDLSAIRRNAKLVSDLCMDLGTNLILLEDEELEKLRHMHLEKGVPAELKVLFHFFSSHNSMSYLGKRERPGGGFGRSFRSRGGYFGSGGRW
jgi:hypothetical protein